MKKLYFWLAAYQLAHVAGRHLCCQTGAFGWVPAVTMLLFTGVLAANAGLSRESLTDMRWLRTLRRVDGCILPALFVPALLNLCASEALNLTVSELVFVVCVSASEELLFRCLALDAFSGRSPLGGILCSAGLFSVFHGLNLLQGAAWEDVLLQAVFAFAAGICYAGARLRWKSLAPCVLAHIFTNLTGFSLAEEAARPLYLGGILVYACIGFWMLNVDFSKKKEIAK